MLMLYRQALNVRKPNESDHVVLCMEGKQGQWVTVSPLGNYFFWQCKRPQYQINPAVTLDGNRWMKRVFVAS